MYNPDRKPPKMDARGRIALDSATSALRQTRQKNAAEDCLLRHQLDNLDRQRRRSLLELSGTEAKLIKDISKRAQTSQSAVSSTNVSRTMSHSHTFPSGQLQSTPKSSSPLKPNSAQNSKVFFPLGKLPASVVRAMSPKQLRSGNSRNQSHILSPWHQESGISGNHGHDLSPWQRESGNSESRYCPKFPRQRDVGNPDKVLESEFSDKNFKHEVDALVEAKRLRFISSNKDVLSKSFYEDGEKCLVEKQQTKRRFGEKAQHKLNATCNSEDQRSGKEAKTVRFMYTHSKDNESKDNSSTFHMPSLAKNMKTKLCFKDSCIETDPHNADCQCNFHVDITMSRSIPKTGESKFHRGETNGPSQVEKGRIFSSAVLGHDSASLAKPSKYKTGPDCKDRSNQNHPMIRVNIAPSKEKQGHPRLSSITHEVITSRDLPMNRRRHSMYVDGGVLQLGSENTREQWEELSQYLAGVRRQQSITTHHHGPCPSPKPTNASGTRDSTHSRTHHPLDQSRLASRRHSDGTFLSLAGAVRHSKILEAASRSNLGRRLSEIPYDHPCALADQRKRNTSVLKLAGMHTILQNSAVALTHRKSH